MMSFTKSPSEEAQESEGKSKSVPLDTNIIISTGVTRKRRQNELTAEERRALREAVSELQIRKLPPTQRGRHNKPRPKSSTKPKPPVKVHGTLYSYNKLDCRCPECTRAKREYGQRYRSLGAIEEVSAPIEHGTSETEYNKCRKRPEGACEHCRVASREARKKRKRTS